MNADNYIKTDAVTDLIKIEMESGSSMVVQLDAKNAPITVKNFQSLVKDGFYNGLIFHRVIAGFMVQGGDPTGTGMSGSKQTIKGEFRMNGVPNTLSHRRGVISMARTNYPDSASSQFFICHDDATFLDGQYAAFGCVVEGIETVDEIAAARTDAMDKPLSPQRMKAVYFVQKG
ncbi:MAG TPA: peptidylprolyl isomerase [Clostridiales bacterium]|nr:peptidylprolyl isomerase [Clostridiales bacterium]